MRIRNLFACLLSIAAPVTAQTVASAPIAGATTVTLVTPPAKAGDNITIFTSSIPGKCGKAPATAVPLLPNTSSVVLAGTQTTVTLQTPVLPGEILCATITAPDGTTVRGTTPEVTAIAAPAAAKNAPLIKAAEGAHIQAVSDVSHDITVDALLLPASVAKRIFGGELAKHYAVVQMVISNHNQDDALILQTAMLDYSHWLFSNNFQSPIVQNSTLDLSSSQAANKQYTVPSVDSREVRGQLQDAQVWSIRNTIIRGLTLAGAIATSYQFVTVDPNYLKGIAAFGNTAVPAVATFWPDRTPGQIDRVNDFGFQTNHVIPKGGSDTIIGFFPLDDFLLPDEKKIFLNAPAAFFTPGQMMFDKKYSGVLAEKVRGLGFPGVTKTTPTEQINAYVVTALKNYEDEATILAQPIPSDPSAKTIYDAHLNAASTAFNFNQRVLLSVLQKASLSNIRVVVGGVMTVDVDAVPAIVEEINVTDDTKATTWASGNMVQGSITGSFLSNATITIAGLGTTLSSAAGTITIDPKNSSDRVLAFLFPLSASVTPGTVLTFTLSKQAKNGTTTTSKPWPYTVPTPPATPAPAAPVAATPAPAPAPAASAAATPAPAANVGGAK